MNRISKKLLLCALLVGGIFTSNVNADSLTSDEIAAQNAQENIDLSMFDDEEKRAERAAKKVAAETDDIDYSTDNLYEEETSTPASTSMTEEKSSKTKKRRKSARGKKSKKAGSKSTRKSKKGSQSKKRRIARKKSVRKAKATRKSRTNRPRRQPKGAANNKGRVKSWKARHKKTQASRRKHISKKAPTTSAQRGAAIARKRAEKMLAKQPWTLKQHTSAKRLRARLTKLLPQPYTREDTDLMERLDSSIDARTITVE